VWAIRMGFMILMCRLGRGVWGGWRVEGGGVSVWFVCEPEASTYVCSSVTPQPIKVCFNGKIQYCTALVNFYSIEHYM
jgi:hypothetical protein